ncbi:mycofactocin-coupled SDR family oxidoreductase [Nocardioides sp. CER19]|uniref:mycofactocin-coupled SDR family oxidoreductase n=1 Tax=Nocardioides sp. CER19 TaxID=3038538 RepID=UPI0024490862|nr:mycofactocin-coupled SDR family oxidoreductase [Nocardioides sp. CER19]MDH2416147.1 mycofactocin-coupled SDR family oxidoreductase [Nocardioides sp. CER19]
MGQFDDQVVLITGAARGQGRAHAVGFAEQGASIVALDACAPVDGIRYALASKEDLAETADLVKRAGGEILTRIADVRAQSDLDEAVSEALAAFGRIDHVIANAGVFSHAPKTWEMTEETWTTTVDIDLNGVWRTCKAAIPAMIEGGRGGSITITASSNGYRGEHGHPAYNASKLGIVALMRVLAAELGEHSIRVNTIHPTTVKTPLMWNDELVSIFAPGETTRTISIDDWWEGMVGMNILPIGAMEAEDITRVVQFLASDAGRYITASEIPIDAGYIMKMGNQG